MTPAPLIHVRIAEVKVARSPAVLKATLGSCVGIAFLYKEKGKFGLAHCLLPEAPKQVLEIGAKYVSQAIPSLLRLLGLKEGHLEGVEIHAAGGGNMFSQLGTRNGDHVGQQNSAAVVTHLARLGVRPKSLDFGGELARQIIVDCATATVTVLKVDKGVMA